MSTYLHTPPAPPGPAIPPSGYSPHRIAAYRPPLPLPLHLHLVFLIYVAGNCAGAFFAGPASERFGRRAGMFIGGFIILLGAAVITGAQSRAMFLGGRFTLGFGIAISTTAAPTWITELAPANWRGRLGAMYNSCFFVGAIPATGIMVGTQTMNSTWAWRLPLMLQVRLFTLLRSLWKLRFPRPTCV